MIGFAALPEDGHVVVDDGVLVARRLQPQHYPLLLLRTHHWRHQPCIEENMLNTLVPFEVGLARSCTTKFNRRFHLTDSRYEGRECLKFRMVLMPGDRRSG